MTLTTKIFLLLTPCLQTIAGYRLIDTEVQTVKNYLSDIVSTRHADSAGSMPSSQISSILPTD